MFNAVFFFEDESTCVNLDKLSRESRQVNVQRALHRFPQAFEVTSILNSYRPELIFLDLSDWSSALAAAEDIHTIAPQTAMIGFGAGWEPSRQAQSEAAGIGALMVSPVTLKKFQDAVDCAVHKVRNKVQDNLVAFLPAKAGSGSTTIAVNLAGYLSATSDGDGPCRKPLLIDVDLHSGVISELLGCRGRRSVLDALENSAELDYSQWSRYVTSSHGFDILLSSRSQPAAVPLWSSYHHLLNFAAPRYDNILVDLPEVVNDATVEVVRRARWVFVVCTLEAPSLALVPQRFEELRHRGVPAERIRIVLNRWIKGGPTESELEGILGYPVYGIFGNDYQAVCAASTAKTLINPETRLGRTYTAFARKLAGLPAIAFPPEPGPKMSFLKGFGARFSHASSGGN